VLSLLRKLEASHPFTEQEAWGLFRLAAIGEAVGWTVLITGILIRKYKLPGHTFAVILAGQIHGTLFIVYFGILIATYSSLGWSRKKFLLAVLVGVPPYGTLLFEQWAMHLRRTEFWQTHLYSMTGVVIADKLQAKGSGSSLVVADS
jgi:integral membrane protein